VSSVVIAPNVKCVKLYTSQTTPYPMKNISKSAYAQPTLNYKSECGSIKYPMKLTKTSNKVGSMKCLENFVFSHTIIQSVVC